MHHMGKLNDGLWMVVHFVIIGPVLNRVFKGLAKRYRFLCDVALKSCCYWERILGNTNCPNFRDVVDIHSFVGDLVE